MDRRHLLAAGLALAVAPRAVLAAVPEVDQRFLKLLGRAPRPAQPIGDYVPARRSGRILYLSTTTARTDGQPDFRGKVGGELTLAQGQQAARAAALAMLETIYNELGGTLAPVTQILNMVGYVASADGFYDQASVMNGATAVLIEVFGADIGRSSRSAIGIKAMSRDAAVSIAATVEVQA
ncbi:RidA family protein [Sphingoaurantiacus capsulatus]|uniref:RidA family protein n=1 Tax=Sphingoaurantiacus capsulatus TaxID=1771310 RepID=A0ABV7XDS9_9SPHN